MRCYVCGDREIPWGEPLYVARLSHRANGAAEPNRGWSEQAPCLQLARIVHRRGRRLREPLLDAGFPVAVRYSLGNERRCSVDCDLRSLRHSFVFPWLRSALTIPMIPATANDQKSSSSPHHQRERGPRKETELLGCRS